ncbi:hypothetical protein [Streptomyces sp. NBC_01483]|nr:hypothetical protein [Streptomyces sp. NBC_01483]
MSSPVGQRPVYLSSVMLGFECPSRTWTTFTFAFLAIKQDA